jgi:hypothetical protein
MGPIILDNWSASDWEVEEAKRFTDPFFTIKCFTAARTGILPRTMDFASVRCVFATFSPDDFVLVLYTNRSGRSSDIDRFWRKANHMMSEYGEDNDLLQLTARIKNWASKQRPRSKRLFSNDSLKISTGTMKKSQMIGSSTCERGYISK